MIWIAVIDNERGILFNKRRQSQDKLLRERILKVTADSILWISPYTAIQFGEKLPKHVRIAENIPIKNSKEEYVFFEEETPFAYMEYIDKIVLYHWNRNYPADTYFNIDLSLWKCSNVYEFAGTSHENITEEISVK